MTWRGRRDVYSRSKARAVPGKSTEGKELMGGCQRQLRLSGRLSDNLRQPSRPWRRDVLLLAYALRRAFAIKGERSWLTMSGSWESVGARLRPREWVTCSPRRSQTRGWLAKV